MVNNMFVSFNTAKIGYIFDIRTIILLNKSELFLNSC